MPIYNSEADKEVDNNNNKPGVPTFQMKMDIRHSGDKDLQALISHTKAISESSITTKTKAKLLPAINSSLSLAFGRI